MLDAHNFYTVLSSLFYVTKPFGLAPFKVNNECYRKSKANVLWSMIFMFSNFIYAMIYLDHHSMFGTSTLTKVPAVINGYLSPLSMFLYILFGYIHCNKILKVLQDINNFDKDMQNFLLLNLIKEYRKNRMYLLMGITAQIAHISLSILFTVLVTGYNTLEYFFQLFVLFIIPTMCNAFVGLQCSVLILCLKQRFRWLNRRVDAISKNLENSLPSFKKRKDGKRLEKPMPPFNIAMVLEKIRVQHHFLCLVSSNLNKAYSVQILLMVLKNFITIITGLFYLGRYIMFVVQVDMLYLIYCSIQLSLAIVQLLLLSIVCSSTSSEAQKTGSAIHNITTCSNKPKEELKMQVSYFSLQLLHQRIEFTACRIFVVNESLLLTIVGAASTYLVIVIQFQLQDYNKTPKILNGTGI